MTSQLDMFSENAQSVRGASAPTSRVRQAGSTPNEAEMVRILQATGRYQILKKLEPQAIAPAPRPGYPLRGVILDTETTGLDAKKDEIIIAHNAGFDRPFCEAFSSVFAWKAWTCSNSEIDWSARGYEGTKLGYLINQSGYFHVGHRAVDDCFALLEVLALTRSGAEQSPFAELYQASQRSRVRIFAENSPFDLKDRLKERGYRWSDGSDGRPKSWWIEIAEELLEDELRFLRTEIYRWQDADPPARSRFRRSTGSKGEGKFSRTPLQRGSLSLPGGLSNNNRKQRASVERFNLALKPLESVTDPRFVSLETVAVAERAR